MWNNLSIETKTPLPRVDMPTTPSLPLVGIPFLELSCHLIFSFSRKAKPESVQQALSERPHYINAQRLKVKQAMPRDPRSIFKGRYFGNSLQNENGRRRSSSTERKPRKENISSIQAGANQTSCHSEKGEASLIPLSFVGWHWVKELCMAKL